MTKFYEEFVKASNGEFPELKFNSATFVRTKNELTVRFIISVFAQRNFDEKKQAAVLDCVKKMFNGINVNVQYIRSYADDTVVKNKIIEYFNKYQQMIFRRLKDDNIAITVGDTDLTVKLTFDTPLFMILESSDVVGTLTEFLDENYNLDVDVQLTENVINPLDYVDEEGDIHQSAAYTADAPRLVKTTVGEKVYARGKLAGINQLPNYIADIKNPTENIVLCGKISGMQVREYVNKKYDPSNPKLGPEKKAMFKFTLDDTTAKINGICFLGSVEESQPLAGLSEREQVICLGKTSVSQYSGSLEFTADAIFRCSIDFDSIHLISVKPVPERYVSVKPTPYDELTQTSFFADDQKGTPAYLKDKAFVVLDFEATDKVVSTAEPLELAAVKIVDGKPTEVFQTFVKPRGVISEFITELTSITNEMVADSPAFEKVLPDFYKFTRGAVLVGHNIAGYDYPLLAKYATKEGYNFDNDMADTLKLSQDLLRREMTKFDLVTLAKRYNISHENAHRAISDVYATMDLLFLLAERMEN